MITGEQAQIVPAAAGQQSAYFDTEDRNGVVANGATRINGSSGWKLPPVATYFQGDTTLTLWVKKLVCQTSYYCNLL
jgi:hypothetical protein